MTRQRLPPPPTDPNSCRIFFISFNYARKTFSQISLPHVDLHDGVWGLSRDWAIHPPLPLFVLVQDREGESQMDICPVQYRHLRATPDIEYLNLQFPNKVHKWPTCFFYCTSPVPEGKVDFLPFSEAHSDPEGKPLATLLCT
jgi:hypothetical protein